MQIWLNYTFLKYAIGLWPQMQALISNNQELRFIKKIKTRMYITVFSIPLVLAVCHISNEYSISVYILVRHNIPDFIFLASMQVNIELMLCKNCFDH